MVAPRRFHVYLLYAYGVAISMNFFQEKAIEEMNIQEQADLFIKQESGEITIRHRMKGALRSKRFKTTARKFKTFDAVMNVFKKYGIENVTVVLPVSLPKESEK